MIWLQNWLATGVVVVFWGIKMSITIYTGSSVLVIDGEYDIIEDFELIEEECDEEECDEDGIEYDADGTAWWDDEDAEVYYYYDEDEEDWVEYDEDDYSVDC